ncbi:protein SODIUM POTASSIUM ROOT DEFECTIVE 2-like isoform X2 [Momordica charantia]|uniref:Protein SODIUM POTASSIUM ROOT DEFECTIVE 2-like isoform X2 n=1 Tax=Momordica charantia TaxID=3673 RepID=A0A6J1D3N2_MOMCH|nr:protein SODIUM POTASSIUM ROOT DEFECTIVE 2-like isoform X2 [Momordica charantia]
MKTLDLFCKSRASTAVCSSLDRRPVAARGYSGNRRKGQLHFEKHRKSTSCSSANRKDDFNFRRKSCADVDDLKSPASGSSARYLLGDSPFIDWFPAASGEDFPANPPEERTQKSSSLTRSLTAHEYRGLKSPSSVLSHESPVLKSPSSAQSRHQVSLNCKGCEKKVKKHISKMEGVTSYSVDFTTKKVTIIGEVTPFGVLESVSKVKHAQLWPSPTSSTSSSSSSSTPKSSASSPTF